MNNLEKFAMDIFNEYNLEGHRTVSNIVEVDKNANSLTYEYDYTSLNGSTKKLRKEFLYDKDGKMIHKGPLPVI